MVSVCLLRLRVYLEEPTKGETIKSGAHVFCLGILSCLSFVKNGEDTKQERMPAMIKLLYQRKLDRLTEPIGGHSAQIDAGGLCISVIIMPIP